MNYGENYGDAYGDEIAWRHHLARQGITFGARHAGAMPWQTFTSDLVADRVADALISEDALLAVLEREYPELPGALAVLLANAIGHGGDGPVEVRREAAKLAAEALEPVVRRAVEGGVL